MSEGNPLDFEAICHYVGRLYLQSQHEIQRLSTTQGHPVIESLHSNLAAAERRILELEQEIAKMKEESV